MSDREAQDLMRENTYLKHRCAHLQGKVTDLGAELAQLRAQLEWLRGAPDAGRPGF